MAVEIPVVVNIEKAFEDAAARVGTAMKPFQQKLESEMANLKLNVNPKGYEPDMRSLESILRNVKEMIGDVNFGFEHLTSALSNAKARLSELYAIGSKNGGLNTNQRLIASELTEAIALLEREVDLRTRAGNIASEEAKRQIAVTRAIQDGDAAMQMEAKTVNELNAKLSALRGKLNNLDPKSKEWSATAKAIEKVANDISKIGQKTKVGSIDRIREEMRKLETQWNSMSRKMKFDENGNLTKSAQKLVDKFRNLAAESEKFGQSLAKTAGVAKPAIDSTTGALRAQSTVMRQLASAASMYVSVFGLLRFAKQLRDVTGELEFQRVALGRLIQDEEYGAKLFEQIKEAAKRSPFRIQQLVTYTKQLAAYRVEQENLYDTTMRLADISAGLGVKMDRLILAYGQVRAASVLRGQELRQFTEAGIPLVDLLAEKFRELGREGTTTADVFKLISARAVPFSMIAEIFEDLTDKGGMFYKMQEKQAETLKGKWEKLKDAFDIGLQAAGETKTFQWQNDLALDILNVLARNIRIVPKLIESMGVAWATYNAALLITRVRHKQVAASTVEVMTAEQLLGAGVSKTSIRLLGYATTTKLVTRANAVLATSNSFLAKSFARLTLAILSNPYAAAAAAVLGLVAVFTTWRKSANGANESMNDLNATIEKLSEDKGKHDKVEKMVNVYEKLATNANRSADETKKLSKTIKNLQREFPDLTISMDDDTESIARNTAEMRKNNDERLKMSREAAQASLQLAKDELGDYEKNRVDILKNLKNASNLYGELSGKRKQPGWGKMDERSYELAKEGLEKWETALDEVDQKIQRTESKISRLEGYLGDGTAVTVEAWKDQLRKMQLASNGAQLFDNEQLEGWTRLYDVSNDLEKEWKKLKEDLDAMKNSMDSVDPAFLDEWGSDISDLESKIKGMELIQAFFGFAWGKKTTHTGYQQDPFIARMQERIKFMQDFKRGYDDLSKHISKTGALEEESKIMLGRGMSLGMTSSDQRRAAEDLSAWYEEMINTVSDRLRAKGVSGVSVTDLLGMDTTKRSKDIQDLQKLLQQLWDAKTDFDVSNMKKSIEDAMRRLTEEVKRSETVRNFYQEILGMTGDEQLATSMSVSIYGDIGGDFKDRMQKQLDAAFQSLDWNELPSDVFNDLNFAFSTQDFGKILEYIDMFPEEWQKMIRQMASDNEKFNADWVKDILKAYEKTKTYEERMTDIHNREAQKRKEISESDVLSSEQKSQLTKASIEKENRDVASVQVEALKNTYEWGKAFDDLDRVGNTTLTSLREKIEEIIEAQKEFLTPEQLRALSESLEKIKTTQAQRDPLQAIASGGQRALLTAAALKSKPGSDAYKEAIEKIKKFNKAAKETEKIDLDHLEDAFRDANKTMEDGIEGIADYVGEWKKVVDVVTDAFNLDEVPVLGETLKGVSDALSFVATILPVIITLNGILNATLMANPFIAMAAAIIATIGAIVGLIKGLINAKVEKLNKKIEEQTKLLDKLEHQYERLEKAMEKSFGSEYIYNYTKQLENLAAQQSAYLEQARLEREKGKKADQDKIDDYEKSAQDTADKILDMQTQLSEFFAGTDLTSAADDFAEAWIDAYKEFGSTTDAMSEKFNDMIESMINKSLAAKIMQEMLQPIFNQIDALSRDGLLSTEEIATVAALAQERIPMINDAMTNLMTSLASAGLDVRTSTAGLKGISRDISSASEESIFGLTAAINTQNFYMSYMPQIDEKVAAILSAMTGGPVEAGAVPETGENGEVMPSVQKMVYDHLPLMDQNLAELLRLVKSVITTKTGSTNTNYVAVK